ncbi:hypothetical protein ACWCXH_32965 [Kitasatospora sp. NPDC001660]
MTAINFVGDGATLSGGLIQADVIAGSDTSPAPAQTAPGQADPAAHPFDHAQEDAWREVFAKARRIIRDGGTSDDLITYARTEGLRVIEVDDTTH